MVRVLIDDLFDMRAVEEGGSLGVLLGTKPTLLTPPTRMATGGTRTSGHLPQLYMPGKGTY